MTLKEKRNHYNVKLLRGYGVSISLKNSKIILKNGSHDVTGEYEQEEWFVNRMPYEKIVVSGKGYISTEAMSVLSENNRHVILMDTYIKSFDDSHDNKERQSLKSQLSSYGHGSSFEDHIIEDFDKIIIAVDKFFSKELK